LKNCGLAYEQKSGSENVAPCLAYNIAKCIQLITREDKSTNGYVCAVKTLAYEDL